MHAIGNAIKEHHPHMKVMSITSENFMNIFVETLQRNQGKIIPQHIPQYRRAHDRRYSVP